jgi:radical SAM superfamily enzyme/signal recognition particle subunit SEC65
MKIIPIFIPHAGCPYKCVYCDQHKISGSVKMPSIDEIRSVIKRNLSTIPEGEEVEAAFFGGTFTFLPEKLQEKYLDAVLPYVNRGLVKSIRMSTHPEAVTDKSMRMFKKKGGRLVELGIQSLDKDVLKNIKRIMTFKTVKDAAGRIKRAGLELGVQVMLGLPGDSLEKAIKTTKKLIRLKPKICRIYPALVLKGTELAESFKKGDYRPLSMDDAVEQAAVIADVFENAEVKVIRIGLHPSEGLDSQKTVLGGPYHRAFGEMVRARQTRDKVIKSIKDKYVPNRSYIEIRAPKNMFNLISGHRKTEKEFLEKYFGVSVVTMLSFPRMTHLQIRDVRKNIAFIDPRMPEDAKEKLKRLNYYLKEAPFHPGLAEPVKGHADMMIFRYKNNVIYEPRLEDVAALLRQNGYKCLKGEDIKSSVYPEDIMYNACAIGGHVIHYDGKIEENIKKLKCKFLPVKQGYAKCSIVPVDNNRIITSDKNIKKTWEKNGGAALLIKQGYIKLPGYNSGFIGGASGVNDRFVVFTGRLNTHPDGRAIADFIKGAGKGIIELYDGPLYDTGTIMFF